MRAKPALLAGSAPLYVWLTILAAALLLGAGAPLPSAGAPGAASKKDPWNAGQVVQPAGLAHSLSAPVRARPLVVCVGFQVLYQGGHIEGAEYAGPASTAAGRQALRRTVQKLSRNQAIVLYCGCCPWQMCPNIRPAFRTLQRMGFTHVRVLELPHNFRTDWAGRGYPARKGAQAGGQRR
ncbi:MAG TPA: rhodanese-like domain-containing protein [Terriglobales bacterium]|nr:rhodanese-like domain-containing protein [Terriglobales bacterium]